MLCCYNKCKGGENTKVENKLLFTLIFLMLLLVSINTVFAGDNETISDVVSTQSDLNEITHVSSAQSSHLDEDKLEANNNIINIHVTDSYNKTSKNWDEDGFIPFEKYEVVKL